MTIKKAQIPHLGSPLTTSDLRGKLWPCGGSAGDAAAAALSGGEETQ